VYLVLDAGGWPAAICGWTRWPHDVAHIGVLTARSSRFSGYALAASNRAMSAATAGHLLVQWRAAASNDASIRLARALGLTEVGSQLSVRLED